MDLHEREDWRGPSGHPRHVTERGSGAANVPGFHSTTGECPLGPSRSALSADRYKWSDKS